MQQITDKISFLVGNADVLEKIAEVEAKPVFDESIVAFLNDLSHELLRNPANKAFPDIMSYAFWIRRANINREKERFDGRPQKMGRGLAFHIAPSNVPVNFAVSLTSAMLAGNACVIRVSEKSFQQVDIITQAMNCLLDNKYIELKRRLCIIRYPHDDEITSRLCGQCDIRIVWGGDRTIQSMRKYPIPPRTTELAFADRHSICIIHADEYLKRDSPKVADLFYTDTYYTDQNACSSPRIIIWMGKEKAEARTRFWKALKDKVNQEYEFSPVLSVDKREVFCELAIQNPQIRLLDRDNICTRVELTAITDYLMNYKMYGGYFFEYETDCLEDIIPLLSKACQTVAYLGIEPEKIREIVTANGVRGVDRIVPLGHTMDLSFFWDGVNMIEAMSRYIYRVQDGIKPKIKEELIMDSKLVVNSVEELYNKDIYIYGVAWNGVVVASYLSVIKKLVPKAIVVSDGFIKEREYITMDKTHIDIVELSKIADKVDAERAIFVNTSIRSADAIDSCLKKYNFASVHLSDELFTHMSAVLMDYYFKSIDIDFTKEILNFKNVKCYNPLFVDEKLKVSPLIFGIMGDEIIPPLYQDYSLTVDGAYEWSGVTCDKGDIALEAGANIGLFSCYMAEKGCHVFACEPDSAALSVLYKQKELYENIEIIDKGLSDRSGQMSFYESRNCSQSSLVMPRGDVKEVTIDVITVDELIENGTLPRVDYIKADIEGAERDMLHGAVKTLKKYAPKLAICTYHYPDDKEVLENIIKTANPEYIVEHKWNKLFAYVREK